MFLKTIFLAAAMFGFSTGAFAADSLFYGTWKFNPEKSNITNPQATGSNLIIAPYGNDGWTGIVTLSGVGHRSPRL